METQTTQKYIHTSPRKLRLVADMVRDLKPLNALDILKVTPKYASRDLIKALETVLANAKQAGMDAQNLSFKKIEINESMKMRRFRAGTRGRAKPYKKRMSHIKIIISDEIGKSEDQKTGKPVNRNTDTPISSDLSEKKKGAK